MVAAVQGAPDSPSDQRPVAIDLAALPGQARVILRLGGADVRRFLQGLLSADIEAGAAGEAHPAALLTVKGKIISEAIVLHGDEALSLAVPADRAAAVADELDRHIIMDDVTVTSADAVGCALVWPSALALAPAIACFRASYPAPGTLLVGPREALDAALATIPAATVDEFTRARVRAGIPAWGHEIQPDHFPPEVGFAAAVSYTKGCFRGQEPLARIHARGQVNRVMVRVRAEAAPIEATPLAAEARPEAGLWTSWAPGDGGEGVIGLAIVHRSVATPGTRLQAGAIAVEVTSGPLGDDPGVAGKGGAARVQLGRRP